jgi:hypothetical protein
VKLRPGLGRADREGNDTISEERTGMDTNPRENCYGLPASARRHRRNNRIEDHAARARKVMKNPEIRASSSCE